jgi:hypothetical protein
MRERVAIVFMTVNVIATLAFGAAIAYDFSHRGSASTATPAAAGVAGQSYTPSSGSGSGAGTPISGTSSGTAAPPSSGSTPGA